MSEQEKVGVGEELVCRIFVRGSKLNAKNIRAQQRHLTWLYLDHH